MQLDIQKYSDYRSFLVNYVDHMRKHQGNWSLGVWARALGLKTTSSLTKIINGTRAPGPQITEQLVRYFKFNEIQAEYFRSLVNLQKNHQDPKLHLLLLEKLGKDFANSSAKKLDHQTFKIISHWYHGALHEIVKIKNMRLSPQLISQFLLYKVTPQQINQGLENLLSVGLLCKNEHGDFKTAAGRLSTNDDIADQAIKVYHGQMLGLAQEALEKIPVQLHYLLALKKWHWPKK